MNNPHTSAALELRSLFGLRVAVVHDWLVSYAGSERVFEQILDLFPQADVFCLVDFLPEPQRRFLRGRKITTSFLQNLPQARKRYARYLPLMPLAIEQLNLSGYDLVISSSHCVAKGVLTGPDQLHLSYLHTPMRYAWDLQEESLAGLGLQHGLRSWVARYLLSRLRTWDVRSACGVDALVANSAFVARRIAKFYRRHSQIIYPPVNVDAFTLREEKEDFYLTASRLVPYKKVDVLVKAFADMPDKRLIVIGDGPELLRLRSLAGTNVRLLGYQDSAVLRDYLERAQAFLFASQEDFGIVMGEAQACGTPVIAYGKGGALEIVRSLDHPRPTGLFFHEQTPAAIVQAVRHFERQPELFRPRDCRENAERFSAVRFREEMAEFVLTQYEKFAAGRVPGDAPHSGESHAYHDEPVAKQLRTRAA